VAAVASLHAGRRMEVSVQAWMVPTLHAAAREQRAWTDELMRGWARTRWEDTDPGVEASFAQGLKFAAVRGGDGALLAAARDLLGRGRFWYSRLNAVQAIALCGLASDACRAEATAVVRDASNDPDPLVARAAVGCRYALQGEPRRWIWDDEVAVSRRADSGPVGSRVALGWRALDASASELMADVIVALNLIEGDSRVEHQRSERLLRACGSAFPACLGEAREDRRRLGVLGTTALGGSPCPASCGLRLCPYPARSEPTFRGELDEAFCRELARHHRSRAALHEFWTQMEERVRS
jgi:hypothetical protein